MKKAFGIIMLAGVVLGLQSCDNKTIDQEVGEYCDCKKSAEKGEREMAECLQIANDISDKYQFDPEAVDEIREKIKNCSEEPNGQND